MQAPAGQGGGNTHALARPERRRAKLAPAEIGGSVCRFAETSTSEHSEPAPPCGESTGEGERGGRNVGHSVLNGSVVSSSSDPSPFSGLRGGVMPASSGANCGVAAWYDAAHWSGPKPWSA